MKLTFTITDDSEAHVVAQAKTIELFIEKTWFALADLIAIAKGAVFAYVGSNTIRVWLDMPCDVQLARFTKNDASVVESTPDFLSQGTKPEIKNLKAVTVNEFTGGVSYMIPYSAGAVTDIMPQSTICAIDATSDTTYFAGENYYFRANTTMQVRNGTSFTAIQFDTDIENVVINEKNSIDRKLMNNAQFVQSSLKLN